MVWFTKSKEESDFYDEMSGLPDRVVGLLAPVIVDDRLTDAIKAQWHDTKGQHGSLLGQLFRDGAQLGSFGSRIDIGFSIGLYNAETYNDLRNISKIRNRFAHKLEH